MNVFGDVTHSWPEGEYVIRFSYQAIDAIEREFGEDWSERLRDLFVGKTKQDLEFVTSLTTGATIAEVQAASPPIVPLVNALYQAWQLAWHGLDGDPETNTEATPEKKWPAFVRSWMKH